MNIVELYGQIPVEKHKDIKVIGDRVLVKQEDEITEYLIEPDGELWPMLSPIKEVIARVKGLEQKLTELKDMLASYSIRLPSNSVSRCGGAYTAFDKAKGNH